MKLKLNFEATEHADSTKLVRQKMSTIKFGRQLEIWYFEIWVIPILLSPFATLICTLKSDFEGITRDCLGHELKKM